MKRRKIKGLIAELDTIVIPIIALNLTFLFSVIVDNFLFQLLLL